MQRIERTGLWIAIGGHVLLFGALSLGLFAADDPVTYSDPIQVSLVGETALQSTAPSPSREAPAPSAAPDLGDPSEALPEPLAAETPPELSRTAEPAVASPTPAPVPRRTERAIEKPTPKPAAKPAPAREKPVKSARDAAKPAAKPAAKAAPAREAAKPRGGRLSNDLLKGLSDSKEGSAQSAPAARAGPAVQRSLAQQITRELKPHWRVPTGVDTDQLVTVLAWNLDRNGNLSGTPRVVRQSGVNASNKAQASLHAENAIAAVRRAAPFDLPQEYYEEWKSVVSFEFDRRLAQ